MLMKFNALFKKVRDQKGFTLVELLVVMAILAVLAALAVPKFGQMLEDSKYKTHQENVMMIYKAGEMYIASQGAPEKGTTVDIGGLATAGFLKAGLTTPYDGSAYTCTIDETGKITVLPGLPTKTDGKWTVDTKTGYSG